MLAPSQSWSCTLLLYAWQRNPLPLKGETPPTSPFLLFPFLSLHFSLSFTFPSFPFPHSLYLNNTSHTLFAWYVCLLPTIGTLDSFPIIILHKFTIFGDYLKRKSKYISLPCESQRCSVILNS